MQNSLFFFLMFSFFAIYLCLYEFQYIFQLVFSVCSSLFLSITRRRSYGRFVLVFRVKLYIHMFDIYYSIFQLRTQPSYSFKNFIHQMFVLSLFWQYFRNLFSCALILLLYLESDVYSDVDPDPHSECDSGSRGIK